jgi:hypothetical protein
VFKGHINRVEKKFKEEIDLKKTSEIQYFGAQEHSRAIFEKGLTIYFSKSSFASIVKFN